MTSQTIDGVPRELRALLERIVAEPRDVDAQVSRQGAVDELRALLDAPAAEVDPIVGVLERCLSEGVQPTFSGGDLKHLIRLLESKPAAQPHGVPVGVLLIDEYFDNREVGEVDVKLDAEACERLARDYPGQSLPLYMQQPAPVAFDFELAAQKLASCLDYPWEHMPEQGRDSMRGHAKAIIGAAQVAPVAMALPDRDRLRDLIAQAIGSDTYDCVRVWSAWGVGTMSEDDFVPVVEQEARLYEIADACIFEVARLQEVKP